MTTTALIPYSEPRTLREMHAAHLARRARQAAIPTYPDTPILCARALREQRLRAAEARSERLKRVAPPDLLPWMRPPPRIVWERGRRTDKIWRIQQATANFYEGVSVGDILSPRRFKSITLPRQVAMYLAKKLTGRSLPEIGRRFGGRDHTTIMSGVKKITRLLTIDAELVRAIAAIEASLSCR